MFLIVSCYIADLIFGDPEWFPHPARAIGGLINLLDNKMRAKTGKWRERIKGIVAAVLTVGITFLAAYFSVWLLGKVSPFLGYAALIYVGYAALSVKDLRVKAMAVLKSLENNSIAGARAELSKMAGRDTEKLNEKGIIKAAVESVAESTNDGIVAPLFYLILGGPIPAIVYKAINTLDSMLGHKDEKHINFGWFSARLDDVANFVPARITGVLISGACFLLRKDFKNSFMTMARDGRKHPSPNSGISEAAIAGALGIELGGPSAYDGMLMNKPKLGGDKREIRPSLINEALRISFAVSLIMVLIGVLFRWVI